MRRRILLADDSVTIQKVIELTFLDEDYDVKAVSNGDEAIAALPQVNPDFVIADVHMPGANGYEVCRRSKEQRPDVPVLLLVGTFEPFDEGQARAAGADSFLKKPFDSQELLHRVEDLLASLSPAAAAAAPGGADILAMPSLSELPAFPDDVSAAPADWGSYDLEAPAPPMPTEPFPASVPFPVEPQPEDRLFVPATAGSFDESPFPLVDEEPARGGALQVDESSLLPAGEVLFDFDAVPAAPVAGETPSFATPSFEELPAEPEPFEDIPSFEARPYDHQAAQSDTLRLRTSVLAAAGFDVAPEAAAPPPSPEPPAPVYAVSPEPEPLGEPEPEPVVEALPELPASDAAPAEPLAALPTVSAAPAPSDVATAAVAGNGHLSDADVDRIARRVVELMADRAIRDVAWEVIPDMAEMVIRDRLRELESQAESFE